MCQILIGWETSWCGTPFDRNPPLFSVGYSARSRTGVLSSEPWRREENPIRNRRDGFPNLCKNSVNLSHSLSFSQRFMYSSLDFLIAYGFKSFEDLNAGWDVLLGSIAAFYVFMVPYTKVEESFNVQVHPKTLWPFLVMKAYELFSCSMMRVFYLALIFCGPILDYFWVSNFFLNDIIN